VIGTVPGVVHLRDGEVLAGRDVQRGIAADLLDEGLL
jgi:hypothetical protein